MRNDSWRHWFITNSLRIRSSFLLQIWCQKKTCFTSIILPAKAHVTIELCLEIIWILIEWFWFGIPNYGQNLTKWTNSDLALTWTQETQPRHQADVELTLNRPYIDSTLHIWRVGTMRVNVGLMPNQCLAGARYNSDQCPVKPVSIECRGQINSGSGSFGSMCVCRVKSSQFRLSSGSISDHFHFKTSQ